MSFFELNNCIKNALKCLERTERELPAINWQINNFENQRSEISGPYQASDFGKSKRYGLSHLVLAIRQVECLDYLDPRVFESSHEQFKSLYRKTSKRVEAAMMESPTMETYESSVKDVVEIELGKNKNIWSALGVVERTELYQLAQEENSSTPDPTTTRSGNGEEKHIDQVRCSSLYRAAQWRWGEWLENSPTASYKRARCPKRSNKSSIRRKVSLFHLHKHHQLESQQLTYRRFRKESFSRRQLDEGLKTFYHLFFLKRC